MSQSCQRPPCPPLTPIPSVFFSSCTATLFCSRRLSDLRKCTCARTCARSTPLSHVCLLHNAPSLFFSSSFSPLPPRSDSWKRPHKSSREILPPAAHANVPAVKPRGNYLIPKAAVAVQRGLRAASAALQAVLQGDRREAKRDCLGKRREASVRRDEAVTACRAPERESVEALMC